MKKLITILFAVAAASVIADEYLYWMVDENLTGYSGTWDFAGIRISGNTDQYLTLYDGDTGALDADGLASAAQAKNGMYAQGVTDGYSYLVDLLWGGTPVATSELLTYSLVSGYTTTDMTMFPLKSPQVVSSFTATGAVPEPTSGLLSLFGLALLAIRRKKVA